MSCVPAHDFTHHSSSHLRQMFSQTSWDVTVVLCVESVTPSFGVDTP